jgi:hypothetical protein
MSHWNNSKMSCSILPRSFGRSSERYVKKNPDQLRLYFEGEDTLTEEAQVGPEAAKETVTYERRKKK